MIDQMNPFAALQPESSTSEYGVRRKNIWKQVQQKIADEQLPLQSEKDGMRLERLASGVAWLDWVPSEWKDIYGALYDEAQSFQILETEKTKIEKDVHRTFGLFTRNARILRLQFRLKMSQYYESLQAVLIAASHEREYCQGINFLAAVFLLSESSERDAFTLLCFLLRHRHLESLFNYRCSSLVEYMKLFEKRLRVNNPFVYKHFKLVGFGTVCYAIEWFTTCFIVTCPGDLSACVIDLLLAGCEDAMIRVGLAIIDKLGAHLLKMDLEELQINFKQV